MEMQYDESADMTHHRNEVNQMLKLLSSNKVDTNNLGFILDVGGGAAMHSGFLTGCASRILCMDYLDQNVRFSGELLKLLRQKFERHNIPFVETCLEFHQGDAMDMIYRDNLLDLVVSFNAFEHIPDPERALNELIRVAKPGGLIYITFDPIWTADTGSHFFHRVPEPWGHLVHNQEEFVEIMLLNGATADEVCEFKTGMNQIRLAEYQSFLGRRLSQEDVSILHEVTWSGVSSPEYLKHPNFSKCLSLNYQKEELLFRGMRYLLRKVC